MDYDDFPELPDFVEPPRELDEMARSVIGAAIEVHRELGPGFSEDVYQRALEIELGARGIQFESQKAVTIMYKGFFVGKGKIDIMVGGRLVVEIKTVASLLPVHRLQTRSYMRVIREPLGLLINFDVPLLKDGIRRVIESES
jgi:GxxExxY protein